MYSVYIYMYMQYYLHTKYLYIFIYIYTYIHTFISLSLSLSAFYNDIPTMTTPSSQVALLPWAASWDATGFVWRTRPLQLDVLDVLPAMDLSPEKQALLGMLVWRCMESLMEWYGMIWNDVMMHCDLWCNFGWNLSLNLIYSLSGGPCCSILEYPNPKS